MNKNNSGWRRAAAAMGLGRFVGINASASVNTRTESRRDVRAWDDCAGPSLTGRGHYGRAGSVEPTGTNLK
jgi:hypothetical protein